ncbi:50S ribosomal protein L18 [bacterium]|nr:MAG: 50S ribosomal protein L18 [bacterium]
MRRNELLKKKKKFKRRIFRVRKKIFGTTERPRLVVNRSLRNMYAQLVDDTTGKTLTTVSTLSPEIRDKTAGKTKTEQAGLVGELIAQKAKQFKIEQVVFDRRGYRYQGRVKALADSARKAGLKF